jgi:hypothetical protein
VTREACAALVALLCGCTTLAPYTPPTADASAALRVVGGGLGGYFTVVARDDSGCGDGAGRLIARHEYRQPVDERPVYLVGGDPYPAPVIESRIPAGEAFTLLVQAEGMLDGWYFYGCARAVTFTPEPGKRYEAVYWSEDPYRCRMDVWQVEPGYRITPEGLTRYDQCPLRAYRE